VLFRSAAGILLAGFWLKNPRFLKIKPSDLPYLIILGVVGVAGVHYSYYYAISKTNVATAILLQYLAPALILLFAVVVQGEPFSLLKLLSLLCAFAGCFLVVGGYDLKLFATNKIGVLAGLIAAGFFAFYSLYAERGLRRYPLWTMLFYGFTAAALFWWCIYPPWKILAAHYSLKIWFIFFVLGVFSAIVPFGCYFAGLRAIGATRASITAMLEPVIAGVAAYLFLGETLSALQVVGGVLVLGGIGLLQMARKPLKRNDKD